MSHATAFIERINTDAELRQEVQKANDFDAVIGIAAEHGYTFTTEAYLTAAK